MTNARPKYRAVREFSTAGRLFEIGDEVTDPVVLDAVLRFGDEFVNTDTRRARKAADADAAPAEDPTPTTTEE